MPPAPGRAAGRVPVTVVPVPGRALDRERAAERGHPVPHDPQPLAALHAIDLEARPAVADRERHLARTVGERQVDPPTGGVPLARSGAPGRSRSRSPPPPPRRTATSGRAAQDRELRLAAGSARERAERGREPLVGQQRREDAARDLAQVVERDGRAPAQLARARRARRRDRMTTRVASTRISSRIVAISAPTPSRSSCSSRRRCASRTVTSRSSRPLELLGLRGQLLGAPFEVDRQPRVLEPDPGVGREVLEQRPLGRPERIAGRLRRPRDPRSARRRARSAGSGPARRRRSPTATSPTGPGRCPRDPEGTSGRGRRAHPRRAPPPPPCPGGARRPMGSARSGRRTRPSPGTAWTARRRRAGSRAG